MVKPLIIMVTFNRKDETLRTLEQLDRVTDWEQCKFVIVDNGSTDGTLLELQRWVDEHRGTWLHSMPQNIGCPRALNKALKYHRTPGQPVVKIDNDLLLLTENWIERVDDFVNTWTCNVEPVAMVSAYYDGVLAGRMLGEDEWLGGSPVYRVHPVIGHCVWHTGEFMDRVGYFDVLSPDHVYGFEDLLLSHKAVTIGWQALVWSKWRVENIQRHNSLGANRDSHVEAMRPLYNQRRDAILSGGPIWTGPDGRPSNT